MQVNQSGIGGTAFAQASNVVVTKSVEPSDKSDKVANSTAESDTVTISQAALDAAAAETQGGGSGTEPPLVGTQGGGSGTEPPKVQGGGSGTEPPLETQGGGSGTEPPKAN